MVIVEDAYVSAKYSTNYNWIINTVEDPKDEDPQSPHN
jgi:hypothetical protein